MLWLLLQGPEAGWLDGLVDPDDDACSESDDDSSDDDVIGGAADWGSYQGGSHAAGGKQLRVSQGHFSAAILALKDKLSTGAVAGLHNSTELVSCLEAAAAAVAAAGHSSPSGVNPGQGSTTAGEGVNRGGKSAGRRGEAVRLESGSMVLTACTMNSSSSGDGGSSMGGSTAATSTNGISDKQSSSSRASISSTATANPSGLHAQVFHRLQDALKAAVSSSAVSSTTTNSSNNNSSNQAAASKPGMEFGVQQLIHYLMAAAGMQSWLFRLMACAHTAHKWRDASCMHACMQLTICHQLKAVRPVYACPLPS